MTVTRASSGAVGARVLPWLGTLARLLLGMVFVVAGATKVSDLAGSGRAVNAYQLMPFAVAKIVGAALPFVEIALGILLLVGLATRAVATIVAALLAVYIFGVASVWARGLSIDCGCFSKGGQLAPGQHPSYLWDVVRDSLLLAVAVLLVVYPRTRLALDGWLLGDNVGGDDADPAVTEDDQ